MDIDGSVTSDSTRSKLIRIEHVVHVFAELRRQPKSQVEHVTM